MSKPKFISAVVGVLALMSSNVIAQTTHARTFVPDTVQQQQFSSATMSVECRTCDQVFTGWVVLHAMGPGGSEFASLNSAKSPSQGNFVQIVNAPKFGDLESKHGCGDESVCHESYWEGACHVLCKGANEFLALQASAVREAKIGNMAGIAKLIEASGGKLTVNVERSALQLVGCNYTVASHIPLGKTLTAMLVDRLARTTVVAEF